LVKLTYWLAKAAPDVYSSIVYLVTGQAESELVNQVATSTTSVDASSGKAVYSYFSLELETMLISSLPQILIEIYYGSITPPFVTGVK
jgi:hypothetical protein